MKHFYLCLCLILLFTYSFMIIYVSNEPKDNMSKGKAKEGEVYSTEYISHKKKKKKRA